MENRIAGAFPIAGWFIDEFSIINHPAIGLSHLG
jgi:hypothetical protein